MDIATFRVKYEHAQFRESDLAATPLAQFERWLAEAAAAGVGEPNAMAVSTVDATGAPRARHVLLKAVEPRGFVFFTNYDSRKGQDLAANPRVSLLFPWLQLFRQVEVRGLAERVSREESEAYFATRPYGSQIGAWASSQSQPMPELADFDERYARFSAQYPEGTTVPAPANWGGYLVRAFSVEFWAGHESRLHDRLRYETADGAVADLAEATAWQVRRYYP